MQGHLYSIKNPAVIGGTLQLVLENGNYKTKSLAIKQKITPVFYLVSNGGKSQ